VRARAAAALEAYDTLPLDEPAAGRVTEL